VTEAVVGAIAARRGQWDALVVNGLAADSPTAAALAGVGHRRSPIPCPLIALHGTPRFREFMRDVVLDLLPRGLAVVWELRRSGELEGVVIGLQDERSFYWWTSGFEPGLASAGPGQVTIGNAFRASIEAGRAGFDFMVGDEPYKYWYGASDRQRLRLVYGSRRPRSVAVYSGLLVADRRRGWAT